MNIAVIFTKDINEGGAFQYVLSVSLFLNKIKSSKYNFIFFSTIKDNLGLLKQQGIPAIYLPWSDFDRLKAFFLNSRLVNNLFTKLKIKNYLKLDKIFKRHNVDLVYFLFPTDLALSLNCYNYIFTVLDLCFLDAMEFPEVYRNREFERRDNLYRLAAAKAVAVITDSEYNKERLSRRYGIEQKRLISLPFFPSGELNISGQDYQRNFINIKKKYGVNNEFIFYPAQFWPHKNHIYILEGLKLLKEKYKIIVDAIFSGSDKGNLSFVLDKAKEAGIINQIHYIGFADGKELPYLYAQALALVMPTYFGPTNIPPLEAFVMGCPVMYSDLPGLREQVKDAALLLDLKNPDSLCQGLLKIIEKSPGISLLIENGKRKIESLRQKNYLDDLKIALDDYAIRSKSWR